MKGTKVIFNQHLTRREYIQDKIDAMSKRAKRKFEYTQYLSKKHKCYAMFGLLLGHAEYDFENDRVTLKEAPEEGSFIDVALRKYKYKFTLEDGGMAINVPTGRHFNDFSRVYNFQGDKYISKYMCQRINKIGVVFLFEQRLRNHDSDTVYLDLEEFRQRDIYKLVEGLKRHALYGVEADKRILFDRNVVHQVQNMRDSYHL